MSARVHPFDAVFGPMAEHRFPALREGIASAGRDARDRDAFVLVREVVELLRELRPSEAAGQGVDQLVAYVHAAYLYWADGHRTVLVERSTLDDLVASAPEPGPGPAGSAYYVQLAPHRVWGEAQDGAPVEPLDGWFAVPAAGQLELVAVFGLHPTREGLTVVTVGGPRPGQLAREDGSPLFAARFEGAEAAGLWQVIGGEELLELGFRCHDLLPDGGVPAGAEPVGPS